ncbi:hypothetical protein [Simkania negevensis]|jgi:hypothetical protein|uniref:Uncharacterized protein n=1 Tax=Simkania negevensis (strain ATCC VR-1471 / DSM 27360 / Z) TaxID=331113 RepID=F8L3E7_SIMNZ|nr:hypothetical protein [Simkania negevensis]MCP5489529.1 hypothetical protein [Chlamydiales bacterium]CCB89798.1 unknown protein [Simkania negevensis Z]
MSKISWEALAFETRVIARDLMRRNFLDMKLFAEYQDIENQLLNRFHRLSKQSNLSEEEVKKLTAKCNESFQTIRTRLEHMDPERQLDVQNKFYAAQKEHLNLRLQELEKYLEEGLGVDPKHDNLLTPHNKVRLLQGEIEMLKGRLADIDRKQAALA